MSTSSVLFIRKRQVLRINILDFGEFLTIILTIKIKELFIMVNRKLRKSKSTLVSVRIPNQLLDELDNICERMPCSTMSNIIVSAMAREIVRIKGVL